MITSFLLGLATFIVAALAWSIRYLPTENFQVLACVPPADKEKSGVNYTYYGFILASASVLGGMLYLILVGFAGVPVMLSLINLLAVLGICIPSAGWMARLIEHKRHSFTVGGAGFVAYLISPPMVGITSYLAGFPTTAAILPTLAAMQVAFVFGEGLGRLGCISFGCCYGIPVSTMSGTLRNIFEKWNFVFKCPTRKACYASGFQDQKLVPIQGITSIIYSLAGFAGAAFFLHGYYITALIATTVIHQVWRVVSEFFRADYRGSFGHISKYQIMAGLCIGISLLMSIVIPITPAVVQPLTAVFANLWDPVIILSMQALWLAVFYFTGKSQVTGNKLSIHLHEDKI